MATSRKTLSTTGTDRATRQGRWFLVGIGLGILLGLAPAYYLIVSFTPRIAPLGDARDGADLRSGAPEEAKIGPACTSLAEKVSQMLGLVERRQRSDASLAAHISALRGSFRDWDQKSERSAGVRYIAGRAYSDDEEYAGVLKRLVTIWEEEGARQAELWRLLADANEVMRRCQQISEAAIAPPEGTNQAAIDRWDPVESRNVLEKATTSLQEALSAGGELPSLAELISAVTGPGEPAVSANGRLSAESPARARYVDWSGYWIYMVRGLTAPPSIDDFDGLDSYRRAVRRARASLLDGVMNVRVDHERFLRDLVAHNPGLHKKLLQLIESNEISTRRISETRAVWVETRLPLAGSGGLVPLLLPFSASRAPEFANNLSYPMNNSSSAPVSRTDPDRQGPNVVLDARGLRVEPTLLPRVLTQSGTVVVDGAQADPNAVAEHGFCTYTPYEGSAKFRAGPNPLWLKVIASERPGEFIIADQDGERLLVSSLTGIPADSRLIVLIDRLP